MLSYGHKKLIRRFLKRRIIIYGCVLLVLVVLAFFAPYLAPYDPIQISMEGRKSPNIDHIFGTDRLGRDIFSRVMYGAKFSLTIGIISVSIGLTIGTVMGVISAYYGGIIDTIIMRFIDYRNIINNKKTDNNAIKDIMNLIFEMKTLDLDSLTPKEALDKLYFLMSKIKKIKD